MPEGARTIQFASLSFDVSFQDIFSTWHSGGTLVLITKAQRRDLAGLSHVLDAERVERIFIPAVALQQLAEGVAAGGALPRALRRVIAGSEQLHITQAVADMFARLEGCSLHNEYGPSEAHVVTRLVLDGGPDGWPPRPSIGRPISNVRIYLLDAHGRPTPVAVPGELHIGGVSLARGYLGRPDLTAAAFVPDPFSPEPGSRLYRTGDLARYLPDGNIEFLGRIDHQVKIRGFRVELGEVETVLGQHPGVREAVVLAHEFAPGDKRLVAYVAAEPGAEPGVSELRNFAARKLPEYMVPGGFVVLERLPLTPNGKVDRRALPAPEQTRPDLSQTFVAPRTELEEVLALVWCEVLGLDRAGVHDDFFELGGHSLLATRLVARVNDAFETALPLRAVFECPTVAAFAERMTAGGTNRAAVERVASIFKRLAQLSESEAEELLRRERLSAERAGS
jgi:acyl-coenzyme A synthetase/AMP-(fatty) acid ligase/acyl carrier protein